MVVLSKSNRTCFLVCFDIRVFVGEEASISIDGTGMLPGWNWLDTRSMHIAIEFKQKLKRRPEKAQSCQD